MGAGRAGAVAEEAAAAAEVAEVAGIGAEPFAAAMPQTSQ
jgi:hypothetical protein